MAEPVGDRVQFRIVAEPRGKVYARLLDALADKCPEFSLTYPDRVANEAFLRFRERLASAELSAERVTNWPGTELIVSADTDSMRLPLLVRYRVTEESRSVLHSVRGLYQWRTPRMPEDLAFYDSVGRYWFGSVARERISILWIPEDFLDRLRAIPNLRIASSR